MDNRVREFDLNIEKILDSWEIYHAVREIIANALDEQKISNTRKIEIKKDNYDNAWHIIDYGRGLKYSHLTQNENYEKINNDKLIGRFGVGLKDALATLYRNEIKVEINSKYGRITLKQLPKSGFDDIVTLHAEISDPIDENMQGTDFKLVGCTDDDIGKAKELFLCFSDNEILEETLYGQVINKKNLTSNIYINGVKVAEEPNFLFSYNITSLTKQLKKSMNRERTNIGRSAYTDRVKSILLECSSDIVIKELISDMKKFSSGEKHDEMLWTDIQLFTSKNIGKYEEKVTFVTADELKERPNVIDDMSRSGFNPVVVPNNLAEKIEKHNENVDESNSEEILTTTTQYLKEERSRLNNEFIDYKDLTSSEKNIFDNTEQILKLIGGLPDIVNEIKISEQIYDSELYYDTVGLWDGANRRIIIKRSQLHSLKDYSGTLLHECAHASSGAGDVDRDFESELTDIIGNVVFKYFEDPFYIENDEIEEEIQIDKVEGLSEDTFQINFFSCEEMPELANQLNDDVLGLVKRDMSGYYANRIDLIEFINKSGFDVEVEKKLEESLKNKEVRIYCEINDWLIDKIHEISKPTVNPDYSYRIKKSDYDTLIKKNMLELVIEVLDDYLEDVFFYDDLDKKTCETINYRVKQQNETLYDEDIDEIINELNLSLEAKDQIIDFMEEKEITYGGSKLMAQVLLLVNEDKNYINGKISNEELEDFVKRNNLNDELTYEIYQFLKAKEVKIISNEEKGIEKEFKKFINKKLKKGCILGDDIEDYIYDNDLTDDEVIQIEFYLEDNNIKVIEYDDR